MAEQTEESKELVHLLKEMLQNADPTNIGLGSNLCLDEFQLGFRNFKVCLAYIKVDDYVLSSEEEKQVRPYVLKLIIAHAGWVLDGKRKKLIKNLKETK